MQKNLQKAFWSYMSQNANLPLARGGDKPYKDIFLLTYLEKYVYLLFMAKEGVKYITLYQILINFYRQNSSKSIFTKRKSWGYPFIMQYTRLSQGSHLGKRRVPVVPQNWPLGRKRKWGKLWRTNLIKLPLLNVFLYFYSHFCSTTHFMTPSQYIFISQHNV